MDEKNFDMKKYFEEHGEKIIKFSTKKSIRDGILEESKCVDYLRKIEQLGNNSNQIANRLGIKTYVYHNDFDELKKEQSDFANNCNERLNEDIVNTALEKTNVVDDVYKLAAEFFNNSTNSKRDYSDHFNKYMNMQDNALLHAMNQKALLTIHTNDYNTLSKELKQINDRTTTMKIKDFFTGQSKAKRERAALIEVSLKTIAERIEADKQQIDSPNMPQEHISPEETISNLYKAETIIESNYGKNNQAGKSYYDMIDHIKGHYRVNFEKVNELVLADKSNLPYVIGNGITLSEKQKMDYFMEHQGYNRKDKPSLIEKVDPFKTWAQGKINEVKNRMPEIKEIENALNLSKSRDEKENGKESEIKGLGEGFHMVR